jgi:hypothetical protein
MAARAVDTKAREAMVFQPPARPAEKAGRSWAANAFMSTTLFNDRVE